VSCVKTAEPIEMLFWVWTCIGPRKHVLDGCTLAPPGEYDWTVHVLRWWGLLLLWALLSSVIMSYVNIVMVMDVLCCGRGSCYDCWIQTWQCCVCQLHSSACRAFIKPLSLVLVLHVLRSRRQPGGVHDSWRHSTAQSVAEAGYARRNWHHWTLASGRSSAQFRQLYTLWGTGTSLLHAYHSTITCVFTHQVIITSVFCFYLSTVCVMQYHACHELEIQLFNTAFLAQTLVTALLSVQRTLDSLIH